MPLGARVESVIEAGLRLGRAALRRCPECGTQACRNFSCIRMQYLPDPSRRLPPDRRRGPTRIVHAPPSPARGCRSPHFKRCIACRQARAMMPVMVRDELIMLPGTLCDERVFSAVLTRAGVTGHSIALAGAQSAPEMAGRILAAAPQRFALCGFS